MKKHLLICAFTCLCVITGYISKAQTASVKISGEVTTPLTINGDELHQYAQTTVVRKDHDGHDHTYTGVILAEILKKAGATLGPDLKGKNLTKYILVNASDNYQVVFALAELDKAFTDRTIILADHASERLQKSKFFRENERYCREAMHRFSKFTIAALPGFPSNR
ncbi:MAG TPA: hypothetical protein VL442_15930 [Mucilaginibacter sp.]|jgi:hypothetical protein|nr:hypothetical protein [Mucilaginibacter sp.]